MPYPLDFKTVTNDGFDFRSPDSDCDLFDLQHDHASCIAIYRQLLNAFIPMRRMVAVSAITHTFDAMSRMSPDTLYAREYEDVNRAYGEARDAAGAQMNDDDIPDLDDLSLWSMDTNAALDQIIRSARGADLKCHAWIGRLDDPGCRPLRRVILLLASIKQSIPTDLERSKHRIWVIACLCQALKYLAYGNEMFGSTFGFLAFGPAFRRALIVDGDLYVDIGPVVGGQVVSVVQDMSLSDLILYGTRENQQPTDYGQRLRPGSTPVDGAAGYALVAFLQAMGQSWLCEASGGIEGMRPTFADMELGGTFARVAGFSIDLLGRTLSEVYRHLREGHEQDAVLLQLMLQQQQEQQQEQQRQQRQQRQQEGQHHQYLQHQLPLASGPAEVSTMAETRPATKLVLDHDAPSMTASTPISSHGPLRLTPGQPRSSTLDKGRLEVTEADAGDAMREHVYRKAETGQAILSLQDPRRDFPQMSEQNKADLDALVRGAGDVDIDKLFAEFGL